jgi:3-hydroxyacyl-[acyl-carrier-protein] dehydratase
MQSSSPVDPTILDRVRTILRRDLKLGADVKIADDMPFFGGDVDLDSLDMLLLVSSIEKEFGIKIPSEAVGREVFQNVSTLAKYVQDNAKGGVAPVDYLARLPHGEPFRFVTRVTGVNEGESAEAVWVVNGAEPFFAGHFPGKPLVPGVLIAEALAQVSGLAGGGASGGKLAHVDVRFEQPVVPPAEIVLSSRLVRTMGALQQFEVSAAVAGTVVARGMLALHRA